MALRTIADLPALNVDQIIEREDLLRNLEESLFEISYMENVGQYDTYKSKYIKFRGLSSLMMNSIIYNDFDFYSRKTFWGGINVSGELNLSGDLYVNTDIPNWSDYHIRLYAGDIVFNALTTQLSTMNLMAYVDNGVIKNYDGSKTIVNWDNDSFNFNVSCYAPNISCTSITAADNAMFNNATFNGTAVFKNTIQGCSLCALWADLAEMYKSDADYAPGTLVMFGGDAEITVAKGGIANAVITDKPGLILNGSGERDGIYKGIALVGRTPVLTVGPINRFDRLAADPSRPGVACKVDLGTNVVAVALADIPDNEIKLIECAVQLTL